MKTLLADADAEEALRRIHLLSAESKPHWGEMTVAQMLAHCQVALRVAMGELKLRRTLIGLLLGRWIKPRMLAHPFRKSLPTAREFRVHDERDFAIEKANLIAAIQRFRQGGEAGITRAKHPFFGPMTVEEWQQLQWKHLDHHLRQFGV